LKGFSHPLHSLRSFSGCHPSPIDFLDNQFPGEYSIGNWKKRQFLQNEEKFGDCKKWIPAPSTLLRTGFAGMTEGNGNDE